MMSLELISNWRELDKNLMREILVTYGMGFLCYLVQAMLEGKARRSSTHRGSTSLTAPGVRHEFYTNQMERYCCAVTAVTPNLG